MKESCPRALGIRKEPWALDGGAELKVLSLQGMAYLAVEKKENAKLE